MSPRGRRPGSEDTRAKILAAARMEFSVQGYDGTSMRAVARRAGVDPALVHHYFDGKAGLFAEVMDIPVNPAVFISSVVAGPREEAGAALVRAFLTIWDSPEGRQRMEGLLRSAVTHEEAARMLREFLTREVFARVTSALTPEGAPGGVTEQELRAGLAAAQMVGLAMMRYVVDFPAVVEASHEDLVALLAPTLQRYLAP